ncbi:uncharacterized protein [Henckelia pumila]|uniref:uncharacterized protein n=1 Tax=Henckelia pumila TaxID=405737 RepID=UPI003C6E4D66
MSNRNPLSAILDTNKLTGPNYSDWLRNLKIVLASEKLTYVLTKAPPKEAAKDISPDELKKLETWWDHDLKAKCYMLASMSNELQRQFEETVNAASIHLHLQELYGAQTRAERFTTVKALMTARMREGTSVHEHCVRMIGYIERLVSLDMVHPHELLVYVLLLSLPNSFDGFVVNFNMNKIEATLEELVNMITSFEATMKKEKPVLLVGSSSRAKKWTKGKGKKRSAPTRKNKPNKKHLLNAPKTDKKDDVCFHCKQPGHWMRNCRDYLSQKRSEKGMFYIEINVLINTSSWVMTRSKRLRKSETFLRMGNGARVAAKAKGGVYLVLNNNFKLYLKDVLYVPDLVKNIISIPMLDRDGFVCTFAKGNATFLEKKFLLDRKGNIVELEEVQAQPTEDLTPQQPIPEIHVRRRSERTSRPPIRYGLLLEGDQVGPEVGCDPRTFKEAIFDVDSSQWLEAMQSEFDSMHSNQVWTLVDPPDGIVPIGCKWIYKRKLGEDGKMDVKAAFLNGNIKEEIYMSQLEGFTTIGRMLQSTKVWLSSKFLMKDMGEASYILGIKIYRDRSKMMLGLTQSTYIDTILRRFSMEESKRGHLPMCHGISLSKSMCPKSDEEIEMMTRIPYASAISSVMYNMISTRPDIAFGLSVTSRYQANPGPMHWKAVKDILKYLRRTKNMFMVYGGGELKLEGYTDSSFQTDVDDSKSTFGFVFILNGGAVSWKSSKQDTVADSTTEAEYIAASDASKEAVWLRNFVQELGIIPYAVDPVPVYCDNTGAVAKAKEPRSHHRSKHILRKFHIIWEIVGRGDIIIERVASADNLADPLTKPLPGPLRAPQWYGWV